MGVPTRSLLASITIVALHSLATASDTQEILVTDIRELITHMLVEPNEKDIKCVTLVCDLAGNKPLSTARDDLRHAYDEHQDLQTTIDRGFMLITQQLIVLTTMPAENRALLIDAIYKNDSVTRERLHTWQWPDA